MTAKECLESVELWDGIFVHCKSAEEAMIKFAQYHVVQALTQASRQAVITNDRGSGGELFDCVDEDSILNAYTLENIK